MARVGRGTIEGAGGRAGWDGVSRDGCGWRRRPPQRLLALLLPQAAGVGVRKAFSLWARPVHLRSDRRERCEGWREVGRALEGVVGGRGAALKSSHAVALDVCFGICLVSLLLPPPPRACARGRLWRPPEDGWRHPLGASRDREPMMRGPLQLERGTAAAAAASAAAGTSTVVVFVSVAAAASPLRRDGFSRCPRPIGTEPE